MALFVGRGAEAERRRFQMKLPAPLMFSHTANSCALTGLTQLFYTLQVNKINEYAQQILMSNNGIKKTVLIFSLGWLFPVLQRSVLKNWPKKISSNSYARKNLRLLAEKLNVDLAKAERIQAALWANPSIGIASTLNLFRREYDQTTSAGPRQVDLELAIPLDLSGKRRAAARVADVAIELAAAAYTDKIHTTIRDARLAFVQALYLRDRLNLLRQKKNAMQSLVRILENRIGISGRNVQPLLLDRMRLAVENAAAEERATEAEYVAGLVELRLLCGYSGTGEIIPKGRLRTQTPAYPEGLITMLNLARERRPDIKAAALAVTLAREQLNLARAER
jgi:cobalt-zinc-cadmium efflux system outer membrane protein